MICVIFGGADIVDYHNAKIPPNAFVIAADGGYRHCIKLNIKPDLLLGDFDSIDKKTFPDDVKTITVPAQKDDTDMMLAVKNAFDMGADDFILYGAEGGRMGHTFANIQTLEYIRRNGGRGIIIGNSCDMWVQGRGGHIIENYGYDYISLFSMDKESKVMLNGLKYSGRFTLRDDFPLGVSNELLLDSCEIEVFSGKVLIIAEK